MKKTYLFILLVSIVFSACSSSKQVIDETILEPVLKSEPKLIYPVTAQEENRRGNTTVLFALTKVGGVKEAIIHKSSGFKDLDNAAKNYCKGLKFTPAMQNGEAISVNMKWDVKFKLNDFRKEIKYKIAKVKDLYSQIEELTGAEKTVAQSEVLELHEEILFDVKDAFKLNEYIYGVVQKENKEKWNEISKTYPLTFLLYHDFIERFGEYDSLTNVKEKLEYAVKQDLEYLKATHNISGDHKIDKTVLMKKIEKFVENNYPKFVNNKIS